MISDGRYTLVYKDGQYRTVQIRKQPEGKWAAGATVLRLKEGSKFYGCGFLQPNGKVNFWKTFRGANKPERLERIQKAVDRVVADPDAAGLAFAMKENRCYKCGKELTVPASIHRGMGPECARKRNTRELNKQAYNARAQRAGATPRTTPNGAAQGAPAAVQAGLFTAKDQENMDRMVQEAEREQESRAFMKDPDMYDPKDAFWSEPCGICHVPRNQCSC